MRNFANFVQDVTQPLQTISALMKRVMEKFTLKNLIKRSKGSLRKLCDHLEGHEVRRGRGYGNLIPIRLSALLNTYTCISQLASNTVGIWKGINTAA